MTARENELRDKVVRAAMRVHKLDGELDAAWVSRLHPVDRAYYRACAALAAYRRKHAK